MAERRLSLEEMDAINDRLEASLNEKGSVEPALIRWLIRRSRALVRLERRIVDAMKKGKSDEPDGAGIEVDAGFSSG